MNHVIAIVVDEINYSNTVWFQNVASAFLSMYYVDFEFAIHSQV